MAASASVLFACRDPGWGSSLEWLGADGAGGYACSTITGENTRRYHGLLIAATEFGRLLLVSKLEDSVWVGGEEYALSTNRYPGVMHPQGWKHLVEFRLEPFPVWRFAVRDCVIEKAVLLSREAPGGLSCYRYLEGDAAVRLSAAPLVNCRDHHGDTHRGGLRVDLRPLGDGRGVEVVYPAIGRSLFLRSSAGRFAAEPRWYENMEYAREAERGLEAREDHFCPGRFEVELRPGDEWWVSYSLGKAAEFEPQALMRQERERAQGARECSGVDDEFVRRLSRAADDFVVELPGGECSIVAGYPWFWEWGRDAMIALPGLLLVTGRLAEARRVLSRFARAMRGGLLPNRLLEGGEGADYNTVDASLWFVHAVWKYHAYSGDDGFANEVRGRLEEVIEAYGRGTDFGIGAGEEGLVRAGSAGTQLTWMDAKVGDWVVTPRHGMPVEINALWYNALRSMADLSRRLGWEGCGYAAAAEKVRGAFLKNFWNEDAGCLYDVAGPAPDASIRPNQVLAVGLPFAVLEGEKARQVMEAVKRLLWTPYGLRTLAPGSTGYRGRYEGDMTARDAAYHQGTVWPWLMGPFVSGWVRVNGGTEEARKRAAHFFGGLKNHLDEAGLGTVSEIFDGDAPHAPRGCIAQAWSVGELLRSYVEDVLGRGPQRT